MGEVTMLIKEIQAGNPDAKEKLWTIVYDELHRRAQHHMAKENPGNTLQATALVAEVWLRLQDKDDLLGKLQDSGHFFAIAANAMRNILVDRARAKIARRRGGGKTPISLDEIDVASLDTPSEIILAVDEALEKLKQEDPQLAQIVELKYYTGLGIHDIANTIGVPEGTLKRRLNYARTWLYSELKRILS